MIPPWGPLDGVDFLGRAGDGIRTHDNHVGNVVLYQLSYTRIFDLFEGNRQ